MLVSWAIVMSMRKQVLSFLLFSTMSGLLATMVLSVYMGVPQNGDAILLGDSLGFMLIPSFLQFNPKPFADVPVHVCSCLIVAVDVFSFSQFRAARNQMVKGLVERPQNLHFTKIIIIITTTTTIIFILVFQANVLLLHLHLHLSRSQ